MAPRSQGNTVLPTLDSTFSRDKVSMDLTMCGLLVDRAEELATLYADHSDWAAVERIWFDERLDDRSTKGSSRKIYRVLTSRFKNAGPELPAVVQLSSVFEQCETRREKAQILYFYLLQDDPLVRYVVHKYIRRLISEGTTALDFETETLHQTIQSFRYADGSTFDYADSTTKRWEEGFRSVLRKIGVLETQQAFHGEPATLGTVPLLVSGGFSWESEGAEWLSRPIGWMYLFQPESQWESLINRLASQPSWETSELHSELRLRPAEDTYSWISEGVTRSR
jgi:hypothetical protein